MTTAASVHKETVATEEYPNMTAMLERDEQPQRSQDSEDAGDFEVISADG